MVKVWRPVVFIIRPLYKKEKRYDCTRIQASIAHAFESRGNSS